MNDPQANRIDPVGAPRRAESRDPIFDSRLVDELLLREGINLSLCGLEELWGAIDLIERELGAKFLRMDFGVPGLRPSIIALTAQAAALTKSVVPSQYPPSDGIPQLKGAASQFLNKFLAVESPPECILPTCGATQGAFIAQAVAARRHEKMNEILFLEPGYPPMKAQARFLGIESICAKAGGPMLDLPYVAAQTKRNGLSVPRRGLSDAHGDREERRKETVQFLRL